MLHPPLRGDRTLRSGVLPWLALWLVRAVPCLRAQGPAGGDIQGVVKSGNQPLPGVAISAANTLTGQKVVTSTDLDGSYALHLPADGRYVVRAQLAAFAPTTKEVLINAANRSARVDVELLLLSRAQAAAKQQQAQAAQQATSGFQSLTAQLQEGGESGGQNNGSQGGGGQSAGEGMGTQGVPENAATESVAVSGAGGASATLAGLSSEEMQQRVREMREQNAGQGGPGGGFGGPGGPGGGGGFGGGGIFMMGGGGGRGRGRFDINRPHGALFYTLSDSAFDAAPYSLTGQPANKPAYTRHSFGAVLGGPLNIPKIYHGGDKTFFFLSYNGSLGDTPYDAFSTVPTLDERNGIFPVPIYDPVTHVPFLNNTLPPGSISAQAQGLLPFIPEPNLPGTLDNFHFVTSTTNNLSNFNLRLIHNFGTLFNTLRPGGQRNLVTVGFHYRSSDSTLANPFPSVGGDTSTQSFDIPIAYIRSFHKITNILRLDINRNRVETTNLYAFLQNIAGTVGINGVSQNPFDWGLPNLSFTNFAGVHDINPALQRNQTFSVSDFMVRTSGKHILRWGGDFRRLQINTHTDSNARGSFVFTGANTAQFVGGLPVGGTGVDFADFLLGLPQMTSAQFGANNYYFRGNSWDLFFQDDWRVRGNLTLNFGLRYEYVSPFTEINNQIVNLDANPQFTAVAPVLPGQTGPFTGSFPLSLIQPDRNNFAPRIGIAWKPFAKTVVRAGYGINYNTGQYASMVQQLAFQPPFSFTQTNVESATLPLTLANGFPPAPPATITNNYGVDQNYALGYVQIWNLDVQRELTPTLMLNLDYTGTKGTHLDIQEAPNRSFTGVRIPGVQPFLWETSSGDSIANAGTVRLRKRLQHGISIGGSYTWSKSIDDASSIGGGQAVVAQNAFDLAAERGPSSFDQTHRFTADYLWELPLGRDKRWLAQPGALRTVFGDWSWSGDWTIGSGLPFTARVLGSFADVNRGTNGTLRADYNGQPTSLPDPTIAAWFNTAAFTAPPDGLLGTAGRNSIRGPGQVLFDMALSKVFSLSETRMLEFRMQTTNIFNTPQFTTIDTTVNSPTFGRVVSVGPMRSMQLVARFRF